MRFVELRRHTANDGDVLTPEGVEAALEIGRQMTGGYRVVVSSGAQRATQTAACFLASMVTVVPDGVIVEPGLRSEREDRWRAAYDTAGAGDLGSLRDADPELVEEDSAALAAGLQQVFDRLADGDTALAIGHSPTNEAAVYGLTGEIITPLSKGEGVVVAWKGAGFSVEPPP